MPARPPSGSPAAYAEHVVDTRGRCGPGRRLRPALRREKHEVRDSHRLFLCGACESAGADLQQHCDRGNVCCSDACAEKRRRESMREAGAPLQRSPQGRRNHTRRQRAYRRPPAGAHDASGFRRGSERGTTTPRRSNAALGGEKFWRSPSSWTRPMTRSWTMPLRVRATSAAWISAFRAPGLPHDPSPRRFAVNRA